MERLEPIRHHPYNMRFHDRKGRFVTSQSWGDTKFGGRRLLYGNRGEIHAIVYEHAAQQPNIDIHLGHHVRDYFEMEEYAGVVTVHEDTATGNDVEERLMADVVLAAEGVRGRGRGIVLGTEDDPQASGYAVYRAWFPWRDTANAWIGEDVHLLAASLKGGADFSWVCMHRDEGDIDEDWQSPGKIADALACLDGWDPSVRGIVAATPEARLVDYKLAFRDPLPTLISPKARIVLIGDAAHPSLPAAVQGAAQAMEDGVTAAVYLELAGGAKDVPRAMRVYERLRYDRVHRIQVTGVTTREQLHKADWDVIWANPELLNLQRMPWILDYNSEQYACDNFDKEVINIDKSGQWGSTHCQWREAQSH